MAVYSTQQFDNYNDFLQSKEELESLINIKSNYIAKITSKIMDDAFILNSIIFIICPN